MPSSDPSQRFRDIIDNIDAITTSVGSLAMEQFIADRDRYDAAERRLSRISEAAVEHGPLAEQLAPNQPWNNIRGIGNWLRHDYANVIRETIWQTITDHLPALRIDCAIALAAIEAGARLPSSDTDKIG